MNQEDIDGFGLLSEVSGHWVGSNETPFGLFDWFAFDFRPISSSHIHSIYEGGTATNIINSFFVAEFEGKKQIMARNGGWLGSQYRATYFVLDKVEESNASKYYRLVDAIGGVKRSYMELRFEKDTLYFDAYKDNSGVLDDPIKHMSFKGVNYNPSYAQEAINLFDFPKTDTEVDLNNQFDDLLDDDSALFLEESQDPFPKSDHRHLSDLTINIDRADAINNNKLLLYISTEPLVNDDGNIDFENIDQKVVRTVDVQSSEGSYTATYLHPDNYFITAFSDKDGNFYPSTGDYSSISTTIDVAPESNLTMNLEVNLLIP